MSASLHWGKSDGRVPDRLTLEQRELVDSLCDRFEDAWRSGSGVAIETLVADADESLRPVLLREIVLLGLDLVAERSDVAALREVLASFPNQRLFSLTRDRALIAELRAEIDRRTSQGLGQVQTPQPGGEHETVAHAGSGPSPNQLAVRCPNCRSKISVAPESSLSDVVCSSCGSRVNLVDSSHATCIAPVLTTLGRFELVDRLGMGGFGVVWKARDKELDRTVAIKIPRQNRMTSEAMEKFFREARTAAQLRHPNIVSVHEVGRDGESVFIVSDFVRGVTLGDWLTGQQPTNREAAELCAKVAGALHYAHEQGVVHRDLKPANIMIDGDGEPHLMDFGLARREMGEVTMTLDGQVMGTPAYMSPEQALGESHAADRRSDIYSLGVILFQLLTGELPFRGNARMLMHQVIHDEPPSPRKFNANVHKDLETITLKCLEKEPPRRYQTARELGDELRRFQSGEPILARPITRVERAWRWCRLRPLVSSLSAGMILSLLLAAVIASVGYIQTSKALREREQVSNFFTDLFRSADPIGFASGDNFEFVAEDSTTANMTARELLGRGVERIATNLNGQPELQVTMLETIGGVYREIGLFGEAARLLNEALQKRTDVLLSDELKIAATKHNLGTALYFDGRYEDAEGYLRDALETRERKLGKEHLETSSTLQALGIALGTAGQFDAAEGYLDEAIAIRRRLKGDDDQGVAIALAAKAAIALARGDADAANPSVLEALLIFSKDKSNSFAGDSIMNYQRGMLAIGNEQFEEAEALLKETWDTAARVLGPAHPYVALVASDYAVAQHGMGNARGACETSERAMEICRKTLPERHPMVLRLGRRLTVQYTGLERFEDALAMSDRVIADTLASSGRQSFDYADSLANRALLMRKWGKHDLALEAARECSRIAGELTMPVDRTLWEIRRELAECLLAADQPEEALKFIQDELASAEAQPGTRRMDAIDKLDAIELKGQALMRLRKPQEAEAEFREGVRLAKSGKEPRVAWAAWFETQIALVRIEEGELSEAEMMLGNSSETLLRIKGAEHEWTKAAAEALQNVRAKQDAERDSVESAQKESR